MHGPTNRPMPIISLFSGAGGLDIGLESAGFDVRVAVELDGHAVDTLRHNRQGIPVLKGDICAIPTEVILEAAGLVSGQARLVVGGPPCQGFSTAGKREADDPRNKLFWQFVRVVDEAKPWGFVMENVKGLLTMKTDDDQTLVKDVILQAFRDIGYSVEYRMINMADYGVPQKRIRVIFFGRRDESFFPWPKPTHADTPTPGFFGTLRRWVTVRQAISDLPAPYGPAFAPAANHEPAPPPPPCAAIADSSWAQKHPPMELDQVARTIIAKQESGTNNLIPVENHEAAPPPVPSALTGESDWSMKAPMALDEPASCIIAHQRSGNVNLLPVENHVNHPLTPGEIRHIEHAADRGAGPNGLHAWDKPANTVRAHHQQAIPANHEASVYTGTHEEAILAGHVGQGMKLLDPDAPGRTINTSGNVDFIMGDVPNHEPASPPRPSALAGKLSNPAMSWDAPAKTIIAEQDCGNANLLPVPNHEDNAIAIVPASERAKELMARPGNPAETIFNGRGRVQDMDQPAQTIVASGGANHTHIVPAPPPRRLRRLTVREAARLQSFPDDWVFQGPRSAQYRQVGNAVPPLFGWHLGNQIRIALGERILHPVPEFLPFVKRAGLAVTKELPHAR